MRKPLIVSTSLNTGRPSLLVNCSQNLVFLALGLHKCYMFSPSSCCIAVRKNSTNIIPYSFQKDKKEISDPLRYYFKWLHEIQACEINVKISYAWLQGECCHDYSILRQLQKSPPPQKGLSWVPWHLPLAVQGGPWTDSQRNTLLLLYVLKRRFKSCNKLFNIINR